LRATSLSSSTLRLESEMITAVSTRRERKTMRVGGAAPAANFEQGRPRSTSMPSLRAYRRPHVSSTIVEDDEENCEQQIKQAAPSVQQEPNHQHTLAEIFSNGKLRPLPPPLVCVGRSCLVVLCRVTIQPANVSNQHLGLGQAIGLAHSLYFYLNAALLLHARSTRYLNSRRLS
jgi:hypothetical protein